MGAGVLWGGWEGKKEKRMKKKEVEREGGEGKEGREYGGEGVVKTVIASMNWCRIPPVEILNIRWNHHNDDMHTHILYTHVQYRYVHTCLSVMSDFQ